MTKLIFFYLDVSLLFHNYKIFEFLGDGIFDLLDNDKILNKIWQSKKKSQAFEDIHYLCAKITNEIIKYEKKFCW